MTETLVQVLADRAAQQADRQAVHFEGEDLSYGRLWAHIGSVAASLVDLGLKPGDRVVLALPNGLEFFPVFYGVHRAGGVSVPVFPDSGRERILDIAHLCGAAVIILPSSNLDPEKPSPDDTPEPSDPAFLKVSDLDHGADHPDLPLPSPDDLAFLQYTSGSTGDPKGVQITHGMLLTNLRQMIAGMEITTTDRFVSWLPVSHDMGLILMTMTPFFLGLPLVLLPTSTGGIRRWMATIAENRATFTAGPDFAYRLCLRTLNLKDRPDLSSLRMALNAAEPVRARTIREFEEAFGLGPTMAPAYGLAEATVGVSTWPPGTPFKEDERGIVSVGRAFDEVEIAILHDGRPAGPGVAGEILFRSPAGTPGYFGNPEATASLMWKDGFIRSGDIGLLDQAGDLFILGREKNIIIQAGRTIAPQEVEETVDRLPFVRRAAAIGVDRGRDEGEQIYVFAEVRSRDLAHGDRADMVIAIVQAVRKRLGRRPGRTYLASARTIPMTHNGKVRNSRLKQLYLDGELRRLGRLVYPDY